MFDPIHLHAVETPHFGGARIFSRGRSELPAPERPVIVGTLRMGYGHYRIARATASWAPRLAATAFIHDPLGLASVEASVLSAGEWAYGACSRGSARLGGRVERAWGRMMKSGGASTSDASRWLMGQLKRLAGDAPRAWPFVGAHVWNSHLALAAGFRRVVNLVPDSWPQPFQVVPETLNLTQNERSRAALLALGVPDALVAVAGHWVPAELAENAERDAAARLDRLGRGACLRVLMSMGGAGAQWEFYEELIARSSALARSGRLRLIINVGDHPRLSAKFRRALTAAGLSVEAIVGDDGLGRVLARHALDGAELESEAALFQAAGPLEAVAATDQLARVADVLVTKPSELAFFPLPKLHIRRVGDHEGASAVYSAELGDGTPEQRDPAEAARCLARWCADPEALARLNQAVIAASRRGVYSGGKVALERALQEVP